MEEKKKPKKYNISSLIKTQEDLIKKVNMQVAPHIYTTFINFYLDAKQYIINNPDEQTLPDYWIEFCEDIQTWKTKCPEMVQVEEAKILEKVPRLQNYLCLILTTYILICSSVKSRELPAGIDVDVMSVSDFLNMVFVCCGNEFGFNSDLLDLEGNDKKTINKKKKESIEMIQKCIGQSLFEMLPADEMIDKYLDEALLQKKEKEHEPEVAVNIVEEKEKETPVAAATTIVNIQKASWDAPPSATAQQQMMNGVDPNQPLQV